MRDFTPAMARAGKGRPPRVEPIHQPGECNGLSDVVNPCNPGDSTLNTKAKARVGNRAVTPQIQVPFERSAIETVSVDPLLELTQGILSLAAAYNLPVSLRRQQINR